MLTGILALMLAAGLMAEPSPAPSPLAQEPTPDEVALPPTAAVAEEALPPDTPTISLAKAVAMGVERNFTVLNSADAVTTSCERAWRRSRHRCPSRRSPRDLASDRHPR